MIQGIEQPEIIQIDNTLRLRKYDGVHDFALEWYQDEAHNVVIKKPGTPGYENAAPVIMQGHLDLVAVKTEGYEHDWS